MPIEAKKVPWSSVVGQSVTLHDAETGRAVAQHGKYGRRRRAEDKV